VTFSGILSGTGGVNKTGTGTATFSNANSYGGATVVSAGTLKLAASGTIDSSSAINLAGATSIFDITAKSAYTVGSSVSGYLPILEDAQGIARKALGASKDVDDPEAEHWSSSHYARVRCVSRSRDWASSPAASRMG